MLPPRIALFAALIAFPSAAQGQEEPSVVDALLACRETVDDAARLACQDATLTDFASAVESGRLIITERDGPGNPLATFGGLFSREQRAGTEQRGEDGSVAVYDSYGELEEMRGLPVARVTTNQINLMTVYLENGQVWRQTSSDLVRAPLSRHMDGLTADITAGAFGSYFMELSHNSRRFRAQRIQ